MTRVAGAALALLLLCANPAGASDSTSGTDLPRGAIDVAMARAAAVSGLPESLIRAVMAAESGGDPRAVSRAGAMGLMQLMPSTWRMLRARLALGEDPFNIGDNVLAGAVYLRELRDRFGAPGFLAAYNAGPGRYAEHLGGGRPLPAETRAYLAKLAPVAGTASASASSDWRISPLFPSAVEDALQPARRHPAF